MYFKDGVSAGQSRRLISVVAVADFVAIGALLAAGIEALRAALVVARSLDGLLAYWGGTEKPSSTGVWSALK